MRRVSAPVLVPLFALAALGACAQNPSDAGVAPPPEVSPVDERSFSAERAYRHLEALAGIGSRAAGTPGAERARAYIRGELEALGLQVGGFPLRVDLADGESFELESLIAAIPGASPDVFALVAPYDTQYFETFDFVGANGGASGSALLLELARVLSQRPLHYAVWLVFLEGEAPFGRGRPDEATTAWRASSELARAWAEDGQLDRVRLLVYVDQVGDADLRIARDLRSHRGYRETFWDAAQSLGQEEAFPRSQHFESPAAGHLAFIARGLRRSVLLMDTSFGGDEPPGLYAGTEDDTLQRCSPESLGAVGQVAQAALEEISARLAKIDRFADAPVDAPTEAPRPIPPPR